MKKLLTCLMIFSGGFIFAQDLEFAESLNKIDSADVFSVAEEIFSVREKEYRIVAQVEKENKRTIILYDKRLPEDIVKEDVKSGQYCNLCETVQFKIYYEGANRDLEIKGTKYYSLYNIYGTFLELAPWWRKHFAPQKSDEEILNSYGLRSIQNIEKNIDIRFSKSGDEWQIINVH